MRPSPEPSEGSSPTTTGPWFLPTSRPSSKKLYRLVLDRIAERHGHRLVRDARRSDARKMIEEIGAAKPAMANMTRAVLRLLMQYAVETELRHDNPVARS